MPKITVLMLTRFREGAEKAASWLARENYESLFLELPIDLEKFLMDCIDGEASIEELWRSYGYLTGIQKPFINALRYTVDPIIGALTQPHHRMPNLKILCYQDLENHIEATKLSERLLLMEMRGRTRGRIEVEEWRTLLRDELKCAEVGLRKSIENIVEEATAYSRSVVLHRGMVKPFKNYLEAEGFTVEAIYLQHYWRSPLEALRVIAWTEGVDNISDDLITRCVQCHLKYLNYVLLSVDIDAAHEKWTLEMLAS